MKKISETKCSVDNIQGKTKQNRETHLGQSALRTHVSCWRSNPLYNEPIRLQCGYPNDREWSNVQGQKKLEVVSISTESQKISLPSSTCSDKLWTFERASWNRFRQALPTGQEKLNTQCHSESSSSFRDCFQQKRQARLWVSDSRRPGKDFQTSWLPRAIVARFGEPGERKQLSYRTSKK